MPRVLPAHLVTLFLLAVAAALPSAASAATAPGWNSAASSFTRGPLGVAPDPRQSAAFALREDTLETQLEAAPVEGTRAARRPEAEVRIPAPDGTLPRFRVVESPVMEPGLAAEVPAFTSYAAIGIDDPAATARLDLSPLGFHATVRGAAGTWFVDPAPGLDPSRHLAYRGSGTEASGLQDPVGTSGPTGTAARPEPGDPVVRREYRLALASDPSYANVFGSAQVDAAKATLVNRANQLYNDDVAIRMVLIAENAQLNFDTQAKFGLLTGAGYRSATCSEATLDDNQAAIDARVGAANYDIGHLISAGSGGGIAGLGVVGRNGVKAEGCTALSNPRGDGFAIDYFSHEVGHQFGANHTFNGSVGQCTGLNRNAGTAVEPGSGSSVMAYAGICGADNLQGGSDPWFSQRSITEIQTYVGSSIGARNGGTPTTTGNRAPVVSTPPTRTIPPRTPFTLAGSGSDPDGDGLVYLWEQNDASAAGRTLFSNDKPDGALFRQFGTAAVVPDRRVSPAPGQNLATQADRSRSFPDPAQVAAGNTNAATGACPEATSPATAAQIECFSEFLPTTPRALHFRLTARDQVLGGGGESSADTTLVVAGDGPFRLTSQTQPATVDGADTVPVTWNVAGTDGAPVSVDRVRILYSTDGGLTFPTVLAAGTPNDGSRVVRVPDQAVADARFRVEAVDNYFFDVTTGALTVNATGRGTLPDPEPDAEVAPSPTPATEPPTPETPPEPGRQPPVVTPPAVPTGEAAKFPAKLRVLRAGVVRGRLDVLAEITRRASGRVRVAYRSGGVTKRFTAAVADGRIRFAQPLKGANAVKPTGIFTLSYAGDDDVRSDEVRLRAATGRARLRRTASAIAEGQLGITGTISTRARGVVRIRLEYVDGATLEQKSFKIPVVGGRWSLLGPLPPGAADGVQLSIQYTGNERGPIRGEQTSKQVLPG